MVEGQKRRVESIKQQAQDTALTFRDRFKEKVSGKARNALPIPEALVPGVMIESNANIRKQVESKHQRKVKGIATYSQAGAGYGLSTLWTVLITFPLMASIQECNSPYTFDKPPFVFCQQSQGQ